MQNLKFTRLAENDLYDVIEYIANDNPTAAYAVHTAILETCKLLSEQPKLSPIVADSISGLRRAVVNGFSSYLVFYREIEGGIEIVRLGEGHRDWLSIVNKT